MLNLNREWSDDDLRKLAPIVVAPGVTDAQGVTRGRDLRNPFSAVAVGRKFEGVAEEKRRALAVRWGLIHFCPPPRASLTDDTADPFDALRDALSDAPKLWHEARNKDGNLVAVHPIAASAHDVAAGSAWEAGAVEMHQNQVVILPPAKAGEPPITKPVGEQTVPKFEDSAEAKKLRRGD